MAKYLVSLIGLAGFNVSDNSLSPKTKYIFNEDEIYSYNILPLLIDKFHDFEIIPIYTELSKKVAYEILDAENKKIYFDKVFSNSLGVVIDEENKENSYMELFKKIDNLLSQFNNDDEVILDITHGLRHIPILMIIDAIMHNIKNPSKIKKIIFAKEKERNKIYEIIDLKEYLDLANLSFIISNFKYNYTLTHHINFNGKEYQELLNSINSFSSDVLALSIEHLLNKSAKKLIESIKRVILKNNLLLKDLNEIKKHIENVYTRKEHRYLTYYYIAKDMYEKGYLVNVISLLFEGVGLYARRSFAKYDNKLSDYLDYLESEIKSGKENKKMKDYYELSTSCRSYILYEKSKNRDKYLKKYNDIIYSNLPKDLSEFRNFVFKLNKIRNNLLHANSSGEIVKIRLRVKNLLREYEKFCIKQDILNTQKL